jgi:predicted Zn-dependent peptidase
MVHLDLRELAPGVRLHVSSDRRWKTTSVVARIAASLAEDPTRTALVPLVLARGTERSPSVRDLAVRLEELYDAELDSDVLRLGDAQVLELRLDVVSRAYVRAGERDPFSAALELLGELLFRPAVEGPGRLRADVVENEKEHLRHEIEGLRDDRSDYAIERAVRLLGRDEPSGRYEFGSVADLGRIGPEDLTERWRALVERHPLDILVVGDHDPAAVEAAVRRAIPIERRRGPPIAIPRATVAPREGPAVREEESADVHQAQLCLGYRSGITYLDPEYAPLFVLNAVLGADAQSRLFLGVREREGLAYEAETVLDRVKGTITAHCATDAEDAAKVEAMVAAEVERLRREPVPAGELEEAKRFAVERVGELEDDPHLRVAFSYARMLLGRADVGCEALRERMAAVRADEVHAVARRLRHDCTFLLRPREGAGLPPKSGEGTSRLKGGEVMGD